MSSYNPWDAASEIIDAAVEVQLEQNLTLQYMNWVPLGGIGDFSVKQKRAKAVSEAVTSKVFARHSERLNFEGRELNVAYHGREIDVGWEEMEQIIELGGMNEGLEKLMEALIFRMEKYVWRGSTAELNGVAVNGLTSAGANTFADPTLLDGGTTAGKWDVAGAAQKDLSKLKSKLRSAGFPGPYVLFYPMDAERAFTYPVTTATATFGDKTIGEYARTLFDAVVPVGNDASGLNLITGNAETDADFQLYAISASGVKLPYQVAPSREILPYDDRERIGTYRVESKFGVACSTKIVGTSSYYFKPVVEIDAIDLET